MKTILFCIPLKIGYTEKFLNFVEKTAKNKSEEWKKMLARYDMSCVKIWLKHIERRDYVFVYHEIGPNFEEKIKNWNNSQHLFDQWFNQKIMSVYDAGPIDAAATQLLELSV